MATYFLGELTKEEWSRRIEVARILANTDEPAVERVVGSLAKIPLYRDRALKLLLEALDSDLDR